MCSTEVSSIGPLYVGIPAGALGAYRRVPWSSRPEPLPRTPGTMTVSEGKGVLYMESKGAHSQEICQVCSQELGERPGNMCHLNGRSAFRSWCRAPACGLDGVPAKLCLWLSSGPTAVSTAMGKLVCSLIPVSVSF